MNEDVFSPKDTALFNPKGSRRPFEHRTQSAKTTTTRTLGVLVREDGAQPNPQGGRRPFEHRPQGTGTPNVTQTSRLHELVLAIDSQEGSPAP